MKKKFLTLQIKLIVLLLSVVFSFFVVFSYLYYSKSLREKEIEKKILSTNIKTIESVVQSKISFQKDITKDYAIWDDMDKAVKSRDLLWLKKYAESFLSTYEQNYFAVFDKEGNSLYVQPQDKNLFFQSFVKELKGNCGDFFVMEDSIPVHVSWSIITTTSDTERILSGSGYLFVAKKWNTTFMSELAKNTGLFVYLHAPYLQDKSFTKISYDLNSVDGNSLTSIYFEQDDFISQLHKREQLLFFTAVFSMCLILLVFWLIIRKNITHPMAVILQALKIGDITILQQMKVNRFYDEWDTLSYLVVDNIQKTKKLKELVATKDKFFDVIAHDLRSPFNAIVGFSEMLSNDEEELSIEQRKKFSQYILTTSQGANKLLTRLLEWARLQTGRWTPNPQPFAINKLIDGVVSFHQSTATHYKVNLLTDIKDSFMVYADEQMIETVVRNLISNAIKFTQSGGFVKIEIRKQEKDVVVVVRDNGKGMSQSLVSSLFKIGENVVSHDVSGKLGTGLGLILCKELVEKNGGTIWAKSEPAKGSEFYFTIPLVS